MSRRYSLPGADTAIVAALAGRVSSLEQALSEQGKDLTALGNGLAKVLAQLRTGTSAVTNGPSTPDADTDSDTDADAGGCQRDWFVVRDPETAYQWLDSATRWLETVGVWLGIRLMPCWVLHPDVVAEILALQTECATAYAGESCTAVSEFLSRWLPGTRDRINATLARCAHAHTHDRAVYDARDLDLDAVAIWWTRDRSTPAPTALRLRLLDR